MTSDKEHLEARLKTALDHMDQLQVANIPLLSFALLCLCFEKHSKMMFSTWVKASLLAERYVEGEGRWKIAWILGLGRGRPGTMG